MSKDKRLPKTEVKIRMLYITKAITTSVCVCVCVCVCVYVCVCVCVCVSVEVCMVDTHCRGGGVYIFLIVQLG